MKRIAGNKGFTMVELMISLLLFLIIAGAAASIVLVSFNLYTRSAVRNSAQLKGDEIFETIENRLTYAIDLVVTNDESAAGAESGAFCIYIPQYGDRVRIGNQVPPNSDLVAPDELVGLTVRVDIEQGKADDLIVLSVEIYSEDEPTGTSVYSRSGTVRLMNAANASISKGCAVPLITTNLTKDMYIVFVEIG